MLVASSGDRLHLYHNDGGGSFSEVTSGDLTAPLGSVVAIACADFDNDGRLDMYVSTGTNNKLFQNLGQNTFANVAGGGVIEDPQIGAGVAWADYDRDGWVDLYLANLGRNALIRNTGPDSTGTWSWWRRYQGEFGLPEDILTSRAVAWADYDKVSGIDFMLSNHGLVGACSNPDSPNRLIRNSTPQGSGAQPNFAMVNQACNSGLTLPLAGGQANALAWGDFNNDGASPDVTEL